MTESKLTTVRSRDFYQNLWKLAENLSRSPLVPDHLRGKPENMFLVAEYAATQGEPILSMAQVTFVIGGKLGFSAQYLVGRANQSGLFDGPIRCKGDDTWAQAYAKLKGSDEVVEGPKVTMEMAQAEGWTRNKKYSSIPGAMLAWRAKTWFVRHVCPEVLMGAQTVDELQDMVEGGQLPREAEVEVGEQATAGAEKLNALAFPEQGGAAAEPATCDEDDEQAARDAWARGETA